jgi:hypothetical protein
MECFDETQTNLNPISLKTPARIWQNPAAHPDNPTNYLTI